MNKPHRLAAIVVAVIGLVGSTESILAACRNADPSLCTYGQCRRLQNVVDSSCGLQRSCTNIDPNHKATLRLFVTRNQACLAARQNVQTCFTTIDAGHQQAIDEANNAINTCQTKLDQ